MSIDTAAMTRTLLRLESDTHRAGWDQPPGLYTLYDIHNTATETAYRRMLPGTPVRCWPYAAHLTPTPGSLPFTHGLHRLALHLTERPDAPGTAEALSVWDPDRGFVGVAAVTESWVMASDADQAKAPRTRRLADTPGAVEARWLLAVTTDGTEHHILRFRGSKPQIMPSMTGAVIEALRVVVAYATGQPLPPLTVHPVGWADATLTAQETPS